jgi:hypothetical protein
MPHSLADIFHSFAARFKTRKSSLVTLDGLGDRRADRSIDADGDPLALR